MGQPSGPMGQLFIGAIPPALPAAPALDMPAPPPAAAATLPAALDGPPPLPAAAGAIAMLAFAAALAGVPAAAALVLGDFEAAAPAALPELAALALEALIPASTLICTVSAASVLSFGASAAGSGLLPHATIKQAQAKCLLILNVPIAGTVSSTLLVRKGLEALSGQHSRKLQR